MLPFKLVYHPEYDPGLSEHVFPWQKYRLIRERLIEEGLARDEDFLEPGPAVDGDLLRVHTRGWINRLERGTLALDEVRRLELPYSRQMVRTFRLAAGGTTLAARLALRDGIGFHVGGGFHHAFPDHGEGFCAVHDIAVAIRRLQSEGLIERAMVVDCDVHHGNGTAAIFAGDRNVFTLSIHQFNNYPALKPPSRIDIHLEDEADDEEYLGRLRRACTTALATFEPRLLLFLAGADPYYRDQLGGLSLTMEGLRARDRMVVSMALMKKVPVAITLAGGYAFDVAETVAIHANTAREAKAVLDMVGWKGHRSAR